MARPIGRQLAQQYRLKVKQSLYHQDGTWFEVPVTFPAALWDPYGYIQIEVGSIWIHPNRE